MQVRRSMLDRAIGIFSPKAELQRLSYKAGVGYLGENGYITSGTFRRSMRGWNPVESHPDNDIIPKNKSIRASARDLFMNTPVATGAIRRIRTNVIGFGLFLQSRIDREFLKLTDDAADAWENNVEREFNFWAASKNCDAARSQTLYDMQATAFLGTILDGDVIVLLPRYRRPGDIYDLKLSVVSGDYLDNPPNLIATQKVAGGIEVDQFGAPVKYYLRKTDANYPLINMTEMYSFTEIAPYTASGYLNLLHLFEKERPGQRRGVSVLAPVIEELKNLTRLSKAELDASILNAFFTVFVKSAVPGGGLQPGFPPFGTVTPNPTAVTDSKQAAGDEKVYEMGSANIVDMDPDEEIQLADPKRPNQAFEPFFDAIVKQIGASIEIPFEQLMLNFRSSYSAARGAMLEAWKLYRRNRIFMARNFCQPVYREWLAEAVMRGTISAPGYFSDPRIRAAWEGSTWAGLTQGQIDPERETKAALLRIEGNLSTHEDEYTAIHGDSKWVGAVARKAREKDIIEGRGLKVYVTKPQQDIVPQKATEEE